MAGATGLEPATFGVTGRTNGNEINDRCDLRGGQSAAETAGATSHESAFSGVARTDAASGNAGNP